MNIKILDNAVLFPAQPDDKVFTLSANTILNVFKGGSPVSSESLKRIQENFEERQYIKIRGFERILFGTGVALQTPIGQHVLLNALDNISVRKGLIMTSVPGIINSQYREEIGLLLCNTNQYLATIEKGEEICNGILITPEEIFLQEVDELMKKH